MPRSARRVLIPSRSGRFLIHWRLRGLWAAASVLIPSRSGRFLIPPVAGEGRRDHRRLNPLAIGAISDSANKCWAARITGSDNAYGLRREFLEPIKVERESFTNPRTVIEYTYQLEVDGLYELSAEGERWLVMCYAGKAGEVKTAKLSDARIKAWVAALDAGQSGREARLASKGL